MDRNLDKPRNNLCKISKFIHILIFSFLDPKNVFKASTICRSILKSSHDDGVWEKWFPNQKRLIEFNRKYQSTVTKRELFIHDLKVITNMTSKKRYQNYNLDGHKDMITSIDVRNGLIASGSKDCTVKIWDVEKKRGWTFEGKHMN